jgi:hypothetical protein
LARANKTKKLMKKLIQKTILIVSLAAFAVALPGCGGETEEAPVSEEGDPAEEEGVEGEGGEEGGGE